MSLEGSHSISHPTDRDSSGFGFYVVLWWVHVASQFTWLLLHNHVFWDDWVLQGQTKDTLLTMFRQAGSPFDLAGYFHWALMGAGAWSYKWLGFFAWYLNAALVYRLVSEAAWFDRSAVRLWALLLVASPLMAAKFAAINLPYVLFLTLFLCAWTVQEKVRPLAWLLYAVAFCVQSLLMFYALPMLYSLVRSADIKQARSVLAWALKRLDLLLLPFLWWVIKGVFFPVSGQYADYNNHVHLLLTPVAATVSMAELMTVQGAWIPCLLLAGWVAWKRWAWLPLPGHVGPAWYWTAASAFVLGGLPYWLLGLFPLVDSWNSRHWLLAQWGLLAGVVGVLSLLRTPEERRLGAAFVLATCVAMNVQSGIEFGLEAVKQDTIVRYVQHNAEAYKADVWVFEDESHRHFDRDYRFYEYSGMLKKATGKDDKVGLASSQWQAYSTGALDGMMDVQYNTGSHRRSSGERVCWVRIASVPVKQWVHQRAVVELSKIHCQSGAYE